MDLALVGPIVALLLGGAPSQGQQAEPPKPAAAQSAESATLKDLQSAPRELRLDGRTLTASADLAVDEMPGRNSAHLILHVNASGPEDFPVGIEADLLWVLPTLAAPGTRVTPARVEGWRREKGQLTGRIDGYTGERSVQFVLRLVEKKHGRTHLLTGDTSTSMAR